MDILIADDHAVVRTGLRHILLDEPDTGRVGEARDGAEALALLGAGGWDLLLLDITMPALSGVDVLRRLHGLSSRVPVVMLSMHTSPAIVRRCLALGASAFVAKEAAPDELIYAIRTALAGGQYLCKSIVAAMGTHLGSSPTGSPASS